MRIKKEKKKKNSPNLQKQTMDNEFSSKIKLSKVVTKYIYSVTAPSNLELSFHEVYCRHTWIRLENTSGKTKQLCTFS